MHETRQRIIGFLKERKQATVDELATTINLTPMAVRYHLNVLQADNLIETFAVRRHSGPGRPQQVYKLTDAADELFPEDYRTLTDYLLDEVSTRLGKREMGHLFSRIGDRLAQEAPVPTENQSFEDRLKDVTDYLSDKGFSVCWHPEGDSYLIHAYSCPYRQIARNHNEICLLDQQIITKMLDTSPTRVACLVGGDDHCTYRVSQPARPAITPT